MTDPIPISALNQYAYCPRRCFLIYAENEFADNLHTQSGTEEHERVDQLQHEIKKGVRIEFALPVWSDQYGLTGRCDVVEFHADGRVFPVEYKHGKRKQWLNDDLQVAAQALCLEEMLGVSIPNAAIYHIQSKRRRELTLDTGLRQKLIAHIQTVQILLEQTACPEPLADNKRCTQCSLNSLCDPELLTETDNLHTLAKHLFDADL
jgi:CRISPR-associated exonuclease Cas4